MLSGIEWIGDPCRNKRHPNGGWHLLAPKPRWWQLIEQYKQRRRKRRYGCGCPVEKRARGEA